MPKFFSSCFLKSSVTVYPLYFPYLPMFIALNYSVSCKFYVVGLFSHFACLFLSGISFSSCLLNCRLLTFYLCYYSIVPCSRLSLALFRFHTLLACFSIFYCVSYIWSINLLLTLTLLCLLYYWFLCALLTSFVSLTCPLPIRATFLLMFSGIMICSLP